MWDWCIKISFWRPTWDLVYTHGNQYSPSSQTSVSILTAIALLCLNCKLFVLRRPFWPSCCCCACCVICWPWGDCDCCCCSCSWSWSCCFSNDCCVLRNGTIWRPVWSVRPGVVASMPSSKSMMSDDDSESEDFFKCWPTIRGRGSDTTIRKRGSHWVA